MPGIGVAIIAQNEELHMAVGLSQFYPYVEDLVVVDGGSIDKTVSWSERMGARVIFKPFAGDFAAQRNFAIEQLGTPWVYIHDADERVEPPTLELLPLLTTWEGQRSLIERGVLPESQSHFDCFGFARKTFIDGIQSPAYPDYQYRLFTKNCRFEGKVHEKVVGFQNRAEVDYQRQGPTSSRFNILHFKSSAKQEEHDARDRRIKGES